jgi:outer membrane protein insertion porin family
MLSMFFVYPAMFTLGLLLPANLSEKPKKQIGQITVEGTYAITTKGVLAIAGVKPKQDFRPETIESIEGRIKSAYLERGFIKVDISVRKESTAQQTTGKKDSVNLQITIHEGSRYFVGRTEVMGNEQTNHGVVMRAAGLRPGEPYNPNRIDKWVEGLNRLGRFEPVKREDIVVELDEAEHEADVLFRLKEKHGLKIRLR